MRDPLFACPQQRVVRVALPVPVDSLFHYAVPDALAEAAAPGCRVQVRFAGRPLTGVVVEPAPPDAEGAPPDATLREIDRVLDDEPVLSAAMLAMLREAAAAVLCPVGMAIAAALPPGSAPRLVRRRTVTRRGREALARGAVRGEARKLLEAMTRHPGKARAPSDASPHAAALLRELERDGLVADETLPRGPAARPAVRRTARTADGVDAEAACRAQLARAPRQAELLRALARAGADGLATASLGPGSSGALRGLVRRGLARVDEVAAPRDVLGAQPPRDREVSLTPEQSAALEPIARALREERDEHFLLHGVTGSGKTEVYLRAVAAALEAGRQALVLVPEITLTHQIVYRLRARFGDRLAVLHSGLRPGERLEQWQRLRRGEVPIAAGARSALFAPLERLGVIVIDEEHDAAYKNEEGFRYHARDLATLRARHARCPLVLGSATPSLETRYAAERGLLQRLVLPRRIGGRPLPAVEIVDLARERERLPRGRKLILSRPLRRALAETLREGGQAILFLNRRGFSTQIFCFDCGWAARCKHCDVALVFHASDGALRCHYCDHREPPPEACGGCGAPDTALLGIGTQRLEEEVRSVLPDARLVRLDRDTAQRRGHTESVLRALRAGEVDVLIGTQLVAKGHDFPGVRLVGVIAGDLGLHFPDFRAAERTFQTLTQVAGRAGRDAAPGRVVLQTFVPEHYAIRPVRTHDYEGFYAEELRHRAALGYPPCGRLAQVVVSAVDEATARAAADAIAARMREAVPRGAAADAAALPGPLEVLGPAPSPLARLRDRYRFQILVKGGHARSLLEVARAAVSAAAKLPKDVQAAVDVNPMSML